MKTWIILITCFISFSGCAPLIGEMVRGVAGGDKTNRDIKETHAQVSSAINQSKNPSEVKAQVRIGEKALDRIRPDFGPGGTEGILDFLSRAGQSWSVSGANNVIPFPFDLIVPGVTAASGLGVSLLMLRRKIRTERYAREIEAERDRFDTALNSTVDSVKDILEKFLTPEQRAQARDQLRKGHEVNQVADLMHERVHRVKGGVFKV